MGQRLELHAILKTFCDHVYFQPPENHKLEYPCIFYNRSRMNTQFADNVPYRFKKRYEVTVVDLDPDSAIPDKVASLPFCEFDRFFAADNLNHDVFNLFF